ncbi:MAG: EAL domain-containing protein, partial [Thiotrichaceae bacterium]|nr:EAL domain-containing protein [Thiotrichaceae bacterium]
MKSILLRDANASLIAAAHEDDANSYSGCPVIIDQITESNEQSRSKFKFALCTFNNNLMSEVVVQAGTQESAAYIHIIAYLVDELESIGDEINFPITIMGNRGLKLYQSPSWPVVNHSENNSTPVMYTLYGDDNVPGVVISGIFDETSLRNQIDLVYSNIIIVAGTATFSTLLLVLLLLFYSYRPIDKVRESLGEVSNDRFVPINVKSLRNELQDFALAYNQIILVLEDASLKHEVAERDLRSERDFISKTLDSITDAVLVVNSDRILKLVNPAAENMLGEREQDLKGYAFDNIVSFFTNRSLSHIASWEQLLINPQQLVRLYYQGKDGVKELEMMASPMLDLEDVGYVLIFKDITEDRMLRRKINYESRHDKLTALLNRKAFETKFEDMIAESYQSSYKHVLVTINIDHFTVINQSCGNDAGDLLLKQVAKILSQNVRKSDFLARLGPDEFGLILAYAELSVAANTVNDILANICKTGFSWESVEYPVTASAALISFSDIEDEFSEVFSRLSSGATLAKQNGGNQYYLVGDDDIKVQEHQSNLSWVAKINAGFVGKNFKLFAQPIVPVDDGKDKLFYEILIRYQDEDGLLIQPIEFLGAAERFNLIEKIDRWVISEAIHWMVKNPELKDKVQLSVNISEASITSSSFHRFLFQILQTDLVDASNFCFEATESSVVKDVEKSVEFIKQLKHFGAKFSLDDFGSGLSSLTHLQQFPLDYLKIDGVYVENILKYDYSSVFV